MVNGKADKFGARGLYNGLAMLGDDGTGSYWDHITAGGVVFDTGERLQNGTLVNPQGQPVNPERPQQIFTRWYGFAYTFPNCEIYE
jgi:hypothetical protein